MAPTPLSSTKSNQNQIKTPNSKPHRLQFHASKPHPSPNPNSAARENNPNPNPNPNTPDHPVEVIARIRDHPDRKDAQQSVLQVNPQKQGIRVRADFGYRDFALDGVSLSEEEDLEGFYGNFVRSRIDTVRSGEKCTVMMYGPTGSGKSHTMFGCPKQPGIVYRSLRDILGGGEEEDGDERVGVGTFVQVTVLEIYNEEIYDLLSSSTASGGFLPKGNGSNSKVRLEVMGKKAKNATYISGTEAGKISKEIQKVEKRRIIKSTLCNDTSSRSHCMVILDVPTVGGRLMLVDMAGSENIEQAGQVGFEAKMQTAKINQGNIALKRVVESIANGDSHVPFRDSKLTMLLQDSFEDDKSKILMILCASPDQKEIHKTISTLEYGAKAKCIVRGPLVPVKDCGEDSSSAVILGSRIAAMDEFILKLQKENKLREKERNEAHKQLVKKEEEVSALRARLERAEGKPLSSEEEIDSKVNERTEALKAELERKLEECQKMANEFVESERKRMEEKISQRQREVDLLRRRLDEIESELRSKDSNVAKSTDGFAKKLLGLYGNSDDAMVKSMELDMDDVGFIHKNDTNAIHGSHESAIFGPTFGDKVSLSTVYEEEEVDEDDEDEEIEKVIEEKRVCGAVEEGGEGIFGASLLGLIKSVPQDDFIDDDEGDEAKGSSVSSRRTRIQNIFTLCGNQRELSKHHHADTPKKMSENIDPQEVTTTKAMQSPILIGQSPVPLRTVENTIALTPSNNNIVATGLSPELGLHLNSTPFITLRRRL